MAAKSKTGTATTRRKRGAEQSLEQIKRNVSRFVVHDMAQSLTRYRAASIDRTKEGWYPFNDSANSALLSELEILRARSRDLYRNNPVAATIIDSMVNNVIGTGIRPQSRVDRESLGVAQGKTEKIQRMIEAGWRSHVPFMDYDGRQDIYGLQRLVSQQKYECGEYLVLVRFVPPSERRGARYGLCFQVVEPDRLMTPPNKMSDPNVTSGIEYGKRGEPVAYYISKHHPGDINSFRTLQDNAIERVPAFDDYGRPLVIHRFTRKRPGQSRGVPLLAPVMESLYNLGEYQEAIRVYARLNACIALWIEVQNPYDNEPIGGVGPTVDRGSGEQQGTEYLEPGIIKRLAPGEKPHQYTPGQPQANHEMYVKMCLQEIGGGCGFPYEFTTHDWTKTTYTSGRMSLLDVWTLFDNEQNALNGDFNQIAYELLVEEMVLRGHLPELKGWPDTRAEWCRCRWIAPGRQWVDPVKDATASKMAIEQGLDTRADILASQGRDIDEVLAQLSFEKRLMESLGLTVETQQGGSDAAHAEPADPGVDDPQTNGDASNG